MEKNEHPADRPAHHLRRVYEDSRIVIPADIRKALGWVEKERMIISIHNPLDRSLLIRPEQARCSLCMVETEVLQAFHHGWICPSCWREIRLRHRG